MNPTIAPGIWTTPATTPMYLEPIAVVGLGGIFPQAGSIAEFWQNLIRGVDTHEEVPLDRWNPADFYHPDPGAPDKSYTTVGCFVKNLPFKPWEFRITPKTSERMDKAQKMMLLSTREALQDAGLLDKAFDRSRVQVVAGTSIGEDTFTCAPRLYFDHMSAAFQSSPTFQRLSPADQATLIAEARAQVQSQSLEMNEDTMSGMLPNIVAGRVAHCFDLRGGNSTVDAACAASLGALDYALKSLRMGETDLVVLGGSESGNNPFGYAAFCKTRALSVKGRSTPFDASADGFVMGEGCGVVLLKRLSEAERDGDKIYAVLRSVGISSDGMGKGITAPNSKGQMLAMGRAYQLAGINPATVGMVEAHGTSTRVGDAAEVASLTEVFRAHVTQPGTIALGSVKSMIGHLRAAAGIAGLIKAILSVHHGILPPTINYQTPNPNMDIANSPFYVNTQARYWPESPLPRRAAINSFGFGGTNFHALVESYDPNFYKSAYYQAEVSNSESSQRLNPSR
ncbi:polyketide synthase [Candidatus Cyanaurora vandensis]|uniref:beta-ketoacyl synthase N-terminal-like domain-containing protein n=1 Tax=Candidatus Cyanaurora vandensis TaxID=2714958 RepID=UPI00257A8331|nr:polyketide synthase [Candidatus Cyanaurora vandensis]